MKIGMIKLALGVLISISSFSALAGSGQIGSATSKCNEAAQVYIKQLKQDRALSRQRLQVIGDITGEVKEVALPKCEDLKVISLAADSCTARRCGEVQFTSVDLVAEEVEFTSHAGVTSILSQVIVTNFGGEETTHTNVQVSFQSLQSLK